MSALEVFPSAPIKVEETIMSTTDETSLKTDEKEPTYETTKSSPAYISAKALLGSGEFETALETVETAIGTILSSLPESEGNNELHPSLAPLYYLYGTTLLYSVEESGDAMMPTMQQNEVGENNSMENQAEDVQVSWENLEIARNILVSLNKSDPSSKLYSMDLAQVYQRLGDVQKGNGNYANAVKDFLSALKLRTNTMGYFDRSVADSHYSLGMTYMLLASLKETKENEEFSSNPKNKHTSLKNNTLSSENDEMFLGCKEELRRKSIMHYLSCGHTFAGLICMMCGKKEDEIFRLKVEGENLDGMWWEDEPKKKSASTNDSSNDDQDQMTNFSKAFNRLRDQIKDMKAKKSEDGGDVFEFKEVLDEIQETIDSSDESLKAVHDLSKMKAERENEAEAEDAAALKAGIEGSMATASMTTSTTIGFGNPSNSASLHNGTAVTTIGFGKKEPPTSGNSVASAPMMVVRKKKRTSQSEDPTKRGKIE